MIIVLHGSERSEKAALFEQHFRLRHDVFVHRRKWPLASQDGLEIDQYDDEDAVYFLDIADDGAIQGSIRVTPTVTSSLIADHFPHLIENGEPARSPSIYECTRYIVRPRQKDRTQNRAAKSRVICAMLEWSMHKGLSFLQTIIDTPALPTYLQLTPRTTPLGLSHPYGGGRRVKGGGDCMAIRWPVTADVLADVREYGNAQADPQPADADEATAIAS